MTNPPDNAPSLSPAAAVKSATAPAPHPVRLPPWCEDLMALYESNAANQFILYGNVNDRVVLPLAGKSELGSLSEFLLRVLLPRFDVVLSYDLGNSIRVEKGGEIFTSWPAMKELQSLPTVPRQAIEVLTLFFRYLANLARLGRQNYHVGCIVRAAHLAVPAGPGASNYDTSAMAMMIRDWATDTALTQHALASFLLTENLNDLHPILVNNTRAAQVKLSLPAPDDLRDAFQMMAPSYPTALRNYNTRLDQLGAQLAGASCSSVEGLLKTKEYRRQPLADADLVKLKKQLVETDCNGLIEFVESSRTLDDVHGQEKIKQWVRQDFALWRQGDLVVLPMGYLLCGPVGTGKTYMVECLAGEAGVPVVKLKNFRDKWVGSTEGNLEKIFRLLQALGRCFVFIDEADQALGKRDGQSGDSGVSGRVYSMMAEEMSNTRNRGRVIWVLASSRPDLIEVDLKRPGRIDIKIPLFPTATPAESFSLLAALCARKGLAIDNAALPGVESMIPPLLTPGAAETLAVKVYRVSRTSSITPLEALKACLHEYRNPVAKDVMDFQIALAVREASDVDFIPPCFRDKG